jgi:hypothetical protein
MDCACDRLSWVFGIGAKGLRMTLGLEADWAHFGATKGFGMAGRLARRY